MKNAQDGMREKKESLKLFFPTRPFHHSIRLGPLTFRDIVHSALDGRGRISSGRAVGGLSP